MFFSQNSQNFWQNIRNLNFWNIRFQIFTENFPIFGEIFMHLKNYRCFPSLPKNLIWITNRLSFVTAQLLSPSNNNNLIKIKLTWNNYKKSPLIRRPFSHNRNFSSFLPVFSKKEKKPKIVFSIFSLFEDFQLSRWRESFCEIIKEISWCKRKFEFL